MAPPTHQCLWCTIEIPARGEVWLSRRRPGDDETWWEAVFCGDEHAGLWAAHPFEPPVTEAAGPSLKDRAWTAGCLVVCAVLLGIFAVGAIATIGWIASRAS